jgi:hypothetical protein
VLEWTNRGASTRFSDALIAAVVAEFPDALKIDRVLGEPA